MASSKFKGESLKCYKTILDVIKVAKGNIISINTLVACIFGDAICAWGSTQ